MTALKWDQTGEKLYETGVDKCALYPIETNGSYGTGVAWNGITAINESPLHSMETVSTYPRLGYLVC